MFLRMSYQTTTAFSLTLKDVHATHAYDFNQLYSTKLQNCDKYGWCQFMTTDKVALLDGQPTTRFHIETDNLYPCHGNSWYCDMFICDFLQYTIIVLGDIKYQINH